MIYKKILFISILLLISNAKILNYKVTNLCFDFNNSEVKAIRSFEYSNKLIYFGVDTNTLVTKLFITNKKPVACNKFSRYKKLLDISTSYPYPLENDGITFAKSGIYITTDLGPSSKKYFESRLYETLFNNFKNPVPVTIFITKKWILNHKKAFNKLKFWQKEGKLNINWSNHTANHIYHPKLANNKNFVLSKEENFQKDVLDLEKELLENGIVPSIFFRFPGLVSNKKRVLELKKFGLIIIGSNSWLAIGEKVKEGSIILVHGNKNEPKGVNILLKLIKNRNFTKVKDLRNINL